MKIKCTLYYKIKETHPDKDCVVGGWDKDKVYTMSDVYTFNDDYSSDYCIEYAKRDLMIIAGGGYATKDIKVVDFKYE